MCVCSHAMFFSIARNLDLAKCSAIVAEAHGVRGHVVHHGGPEPNGVGVHHGGVRVLGDQVLGLHSGVFKCVGVLGHVIHLGDPEPHDVGRQHGDVQVFGDQVLDHAHTGRKNASENAAAAGVDMNDTMEFR